MKEILNEMNDTLKAIESIDDFLGGKLDHLTGRRTTKVGIYDKLCSGDYVRYDLPFDLIEPVLVRHKAYLTTKLTELGKQLSEALS